MSLSTSAAVIDDGAFSECSALETVDVPTDKYFNGGIFDNSYDLRIKWEEDKAAAYALEDPAGALYENSRKQDFFDLTPITSGDYVYMASTDGLYAGILQYVGASDVETLVIPDKIDGRTVISIEEDKVTLPFRTSAHSITFPDSVVYIGANSFYGCGITSLKLPDSLVAIGASAFGGCRSLTSVTFGEELRDIGAGAFYACAIEELSIPEKVENVGDGAFMYCEALEKCDLSSTKLTVLPQSVFRNCKSLKQVTIPDTVKQIEKKAFLQCANLTELNISDVVREISVSAFDGCDALKTAHTD